MLQHVELRRLANEIDQAAPGDIAARTLRIRDIADEIEPQTRQRFFRFEVTSAYPFPADMLRYDRCWPADSITAQQIEASHDLEQNTGVVTYHLEGWSAFGPTRKRWESFMFVVDNVEEVP